MSKEPNFIKRAFKFIFKDYIWIFFIIFVLISFALIQVFWLTRPTFITNWFWTWIFAILSSIIFVRIEKLHPYKEHIINRILLSFILSLVMISPTEMGILDLSPLSQTDDLLFGLGILGFLIGMSTELIYHTVKKKWAQKIKDFIR